MEGLVSPEWVTPIFLVLEAAEARVDSYTFLVLRCAGDK